MPESKAILSAGVLPDIFRFKNGKRARSVSDWQRRREELLRLILHIEYGRLPAKPRRVEVERLHTVTVRHLNGARLSHYRCTVHGPAGAVSFRIEVLIPREARNCPVLITGDDCWPYVTDEVIHDALRRGLVLVRFNRTEIAVDNGNSSRSTGIYAAFPMGRYGAIAAWAWGYHRCIDFLLGLKEVDPRRLAVAGHSRGGKAALLAGATDERIAVTIANNSGCGGAGPFRCRGEKNEGIAEITRNFPYWFAPGFNAYAGREDRLPFDQHALMAIIAPRALLTTEALDDLWANPSGSWQTHLAARKVYRFLGAEQHIGIKFRSGGHDHTLDDWTAALDFMTNHFAGKSLPRAFREKPFFARL